MEEKPRPLRLGVIGAGWFASRRHCPDVVDHPEVELAALCRRDEKQLAQMARAFDVADTYTDYAGLIASGSLDGVIICSPHQLHFEHTRAAREAGLEGDAALEVDFSSSGTVRVLRVVEGLGHGLDEMAIRAAEQMRFTPAIRNGHKVDTRTIVYIAVRLI